MTRVLVLSVSAGGGHVRAAQAICAAVSDLPVEALHLDVMDFVPHLFRHLYTKVYLRLVNKYPQAWGWLYRRMHRAHADDRLQKMRRWMERRLTRSLMTQIGILKPDVIVCTHFLPAEMLGYQRQRWMRSCPVWVQITDFDLHRMWIQPGVAGYFVGNDEIAFRLREEGIAPSKIHVTGLPVMPSFLSMPKRSASASRLGLDPMQLTVLLMGGGSGLGNLAGIATRLLAIDSSVQIIAMTGNNLHLAKQLKELAASCPHRFIVQGHISDVERFMACADIIVTKSGGLTSAECLVAGLPMIINSAIPGQEESNADFLVEQGVAMKAVDPVNVEYRVRYLAVNPAQRAKMSACALAIARPNAATELMQIVLNELNLTIKNDPYPSLETAVHQRPLCGRARISFR